MLKILGFWRWIIWAAIGVGIITFVAYEQHSAAEEYKHHRELYCAIFPVSEIDKMSCAEEGKSAKDYLPWGYVLVAWPEGVTTWAIIATGLVIAWQSSETRRAANAAYASVKIAEVATQ